MTRYKDIEGFEKKDPFKQGFIDLLNATQHNLAKNKINIVTESLGEPAALLDFKDYDFYLAFKTDGIGTKSLIADNMAQDIRSDKRKFKGRISTLYQGLGIDLIASNMNDMICLGATPIVLSDEIAAGNYKKFTDKEFISGLFKGLRKGCMEAGIAIPSGESPTLTDIISPKTSSITGSAIGMIKPKSAAIFGKKLKSGDRIYALTASGIHTNGLSLARRIVEKLPQGYFTRFGNKTLGEELLKPTQIYVKPVLEMLKSGVDIHYMSNISGSAFRKVMRNKKSYTYLINKLPKKPCVLAYMQELENMSEEEAYETWNMGLGFVIFAPTDVETRMSRICKKHKINLLNMGYVKKGKKQVIIEPKNIIYTP